MIAIRFTVHPSLQSIDDPKIKLGKTLEIVGRLFNLVMPFIAILFITALIFILYFNFSGPVIHTKEAIITIMTINYAFMYIKRSKAQKLFNQGRIKEAKEQVKLFANFLLPINIILGVTAIYLGVILNKG